jgi:REP element-mobilizing transposase RayT
MFSALFLDAKGKTAEEQPKGNSFWAIGYYVSTVGLDEQRVREYIVSANPF